MGQVATGTYPYGTFDSPGFDTINVGNLNVHFSIPVLHKAGRGIPFTYDLGYDSSIWVRSGSQWLPMQNWGWLGVTEAWTGYISESVDQEVCSYKKVGTIEIENGWITYISEVVYTDAWGIQHSFNGMSWIRSSTCGTPTSGGTIGPLATDGSGYQYSGKGTITDRNGKQYIPPISSLSGTGSATDSNGNKISANGSGQFTDTTGNVVLTAAGSPPNPQTFTYTDANGNPQTVKMTYAPYTVQTAFNCGISEYGPVATSLVSSISFPDGRIFNFSYESTPGVNGNVTGRLSGVQLPQGNWINYSYAGGNDGIECSDGSTAGLTRTLNSDSGSAASTWRYVRTSPNGAGTSHTEVVDGLGNHKAYDFVEASNQPVGISAVYYETGRSVYQGPESGTPVIARNTCYNGVASPCIAASFTLPISQIDTYETLNGLQTHGATATYNTNGMQTEAEAWDFASGTTSRGALLRKEIWTYGYSIPSLVTLDAVYDGSGGLAGKTLYSYDGATPTTSYGVPQHVAVSGPRGNLTKETLYASSGTSYAESATYEDTGSLLTSTTPYGTTTGSYDGTFVYNTGVAFPTPSSGIPLGITASYDTAYTGLPLTSTDANGQVTRIPAYDSMLRPTEVELPDGGETTWSYTPTTVSTSTLQTSSVSSSSEVQLDGYGRPSRVEVANGQSGNAWYQADICYDANGNATFSSYPYQGTGFSAGKVCSGSGDTRTYDVRGRVTKLVRANGETRSYTYLGRTKESVDENGVARISQVDSLGRTTIVCEISSNSSMPGSGSPVSCGTDITGYTGFTTTYSYALATHTTTITQGAQTRTFQTDWLGRTILVQEPESGQTTYSYAYNGTGLVVTRNRPKANQTSASVLTTTTTQYDSLGRVVNITYTDGTPTKTFAYDASAGWGVTQTNFKGRLSEAGISGAATIYGYDPLGRTVLMAECAPSNCGSGAYVLNYTYDLAGNLLTSTDGAGVQDTYTNSTAGEVLSITSSLNNATHPPNIVSNVQNGPSGPLSYSLGNGLSSVYTYDALGRLSGGWVCNGSTSAYCSGGAQVYGFTNGWKGQQLIGECDTALNQCITYDYDEFNRLTSRTVNAGTVQNYAWVYDRYGNRWQQNALQGGSSSSVSFNTATNQINTAGYGYDAAGNMRNDGFHSYTYDAEGHIVQAMTEGGATVATYVYNALNQRVRTVVGTGVTEYVFNQNGQRVSTWDPGYWENAGQTYWGSKPVEFYEAGYAQFQHQDWLGTERMRTTYNASVEGTFTSLPFGDDQTTTGVDNDAYHYASLDHDYESGTDHAQFRQYSNAQGRWLSPDPYSGSYDASNPQSMNRYVYVLNNPLTFIDTTGLELVCNDDGTECVDDGDGSGGGGGGGGGGDGSGGGGGSSYPPGTILQDQYGNLYTVNTDGSISPWVSTNEYVNGNDGSSTCSMSDTICQMEYQALLNQYQSEVNYVLQHNARVAAPKTWEQNLNTSAEVTAYEATASFTVAAIATKVAGNAAATGNEPTAAAAGVVAGYATFDGLVLGGVAAVEGLVAHYF